MHRCILGIFRFLVCFQNRPAAAAGFLGSPWEFYNRPMHEVVVYSRAGCCLCDVVKETLATVRGKAPERGADFEWREVDIDADPELRRKYNEEVPVVMIDGRKTFKYRMSEREFLKALKKR